jgi:hypothetical protein
MISLLICIPISLTHHVFESHAQVSCYEIYPISEAPNFSQLGTLRARGYLGQTNISKDYFIGVTVHPRTLIIWKYAKQELGVSWDAGNLCNVCCLT